MAQQRHLNELLQWSIINQATEKEDASAEGATRKPLEKLVRTWLSDGNALIKLLQDK